jgi:hypothetical protein
VNNLLEKIHPKKPNLSAVNCHKAQLLDWTIIEMKGILVIMLKNFLRDFHWSVANKYGSRWADLAPGMREKRARWDKMR